MSNIQNPEENGAEWLYTKWPNMKKMDMNWTAERYDYPQYVRQYIEENWIKVSDENGGTYQKPVIEEEKTFGTDVQNSSLYQGMDETNKLATDVMANEGMDAAIKHMFTDQDTGRQLSYSEMRSRYG
jgi:two-component sensor histidine kinase